MSESIQPALTVEEWREERFEPLSVDCIAIHDDGDGLEIVIYPSADALATRSGLIGKYKLSGVDRHALAALALFGQPFGFTHADVTNVRMMANEDHWTDGGAAIRSAAERIAALLPPE